MVLITYTHRKMAFTFEVMIAHIKEKLKKKLELSKIFLNQIQKKKGKLKGGRKGGLKMSLTSGKKRERETEVKTGRGQTEFPILTPFVPYF